MDAMERRAYNRAYYHKRKKRDPKFRERAKKRSSEWRKRLKRDPVAYAKYQEQEWLKAKLRWERASPRQLAEKRCYLATYNEERRIAVQLVKELGLWPLVQERAKHETRHLQRSLRPITQRNST